MNYLNLMRRSDSIKNLERASSARKMGLIQTAKTYIENARYDRRRAQVAGWKLP